MKEKIVILTQDIDPHADQLVEILDKRGVRASRFHTKNFPLEAQIDIHADETESPWALIKYDGEVIDTRDIKSFWYRRPDKPALGDGLSEVERVVARAETAETLTALYSVIGGLFVNRPEKNQYANSKTVQLRMAKHVGFRVPRTLITNDPAKLRAFHEELNGKVIVKMQRSSFWSVDTGTALYTSFVDKAKLEHADLLKRCPCMFQEYIPKDVELRVTVIGDKVFTAAIRSQELEESKVDWRKSTSSLKHEVFTLPPDIEKKILQLTRGFGLQYGAIDLIVTPEGEFVFLEINTNGQFGWIETKTGMPLYDTMADFLIAGKEA